MSLPQRDILTAPDDPTHRQLESQIESISNTIEAIDSNLYHAKYNSKQMHSYFISIERRAKTCADLVKTP